MAITVSSGKEFSLFELGKPIELNPNSSDPGDDYQGHRLASLEGRLRTLVPADLYAETWIDPSSQQLTKVFRHLQTLHRMLVDYVPRDVSRQLPAQGITRHSWDYGTLLFTDLAGFTPLLEAHAADNIDGAEALLSLLNQYFAVMGEIASKSSGNLVEFTGDALLVQFSARESDHHAEQAVRAGLRMQNAMDAFTAIATDRGLLSLKMRVGLHSGRFLKADIGTPQRMGHVLLGRTVQAAKRAEAAGLTGRVSLTAAAQQLLSAAFSVESQADTHYLVANRYAGAEVDEFEIGLNRHRLSTPVLVDSSVEGLCEAIRTALPLIEPLACYLPRSVLQVLVENAAQRRIPPSFPTIAVAFVNLIGLHEAVDDARPEETDALVTCFSKAFAVINGLAESRGGILQKATYHSVGSEMLIHFGALNPDPQDPLRAAETVLAIRDRIQTFEAPMVQGRRLELSCRIGLTYGPVFSAEIGEPRGRREFNVLGNPVNTAARLMGRAQQNQILIDQAMQTELEPTFETQSLGMLVLKGKSKPEPVYTLGQPASRNHRLIRAIGV